MPYFWATITAPSLIDVWLYNTIMVRISKNTVSIGLMMAGLLLLAVSYGQIWWPDVRFWWQQQSHVSYSVDASTNPTSSVTRIVPASTDFGLVIEKINVNERVAAQVDPYTAGTYLPILQKFGVAQAKDSVVPGQIGTTYLFGHSTINIWDIGRYHAPFTLLNKVEIGDRMVIYYHNQRFNYHVIERKVVAPTDVHYLTDKREKPTLIVQTCDPPGKNTKRLLLIAELDTFNKASGE
jgi:LPXTG-site transpeptidase (sortase) family protein